MALFKRKNSNYWWLSFEFEGKRHQLSTKCRNKREAEKFEAAYRTNLAKGKVDLKPKKAFPGMEAAVADFLAWSSVHQGASTYRRYVTSSKAIIRFLGDIPANDIDLDAVEKFVTWRVGQKKKAPARKLKKHKNATTKKAISPATCNRELAFLKIVLNRLVKKDIIPKNPVAGYKMLEENDAFSVLSRHDEPTYLMACSQPLQDVATIMLETGMRPAEVTDLKKIDLNLEKGSIQITKGKTKAARRKLRMSALVRNILKTRVRDTPGEYVFAGGKNGKSDKPIIKLNNAHNAAVKRSGLRFFRLYDLRHTFATRFVENGGDLMALRGILGHSRLEMVLKYAHPSEEHHFKAMEKFEERNNARQMSGVTTFSTT